MKHTEGIYGSDPLGTFGPHSSCGVGFIMAIFHMRKPGLVKVSLFRATQLSWQNQDLTEVSSVLLTGCATLGTILPFSGLQFPYLHSVGTDGTYLWRCYEV